MSGTLGSPPRRVPLRLKRLRRAASQLTALLCGLAFAALPLSSPAAEVYEIDVITSQTGNLGFVGQAQTKALEALEEVVNKTGGIGGRPLKFVFADDQSNPQVAVLLMNGFLAKNPPVILGSTSSGSCNALFPLVEKSGPVAFCMSAAVAPAVGGWGFAASPGNVDQVVAGIRFLRLRRWTRVAMITSTDATGQIYDRNIDTIAALPENKAISIVDREHLNPTDVSATAQIARIKAADVQVVFVGASGPAAGTVFHALNDVGLDLPVMTGGGNATFAAMRQWSAFLPKQRYFLSYLSLAPEQAVDRGTKEALRVYLGAMADKGIEPDGLQTSSWDPGLIVVTALRKLGTNATANQVREYLANLTRLAGANGAYNFKKNPQRGLDDSDIIIARWDPLRGHWTGASKPGGVPVTGR